MILLINQRFCFIKVVKYNVKGLEIGLDSRDGCPQPIHGIPCRVHVRNCEHHTDCQKDGQKKLCCNFNGCGNTCGNSLLNIQSN